MSRVYSMVNVNQRMWLVGPAHLRWEKAGLWVPDQRTRLCRLSYCMVLWWQCCSYQGDLWILCVGHVIHRLRACPSSNSPL